MELLPWLQTIGGDCTCGYETHVVMRLIA